MLRMMTYYTLPQRMTIQIMCAFFFAARGIESLTNSFPLVAATDGKLVQRRAQVRENHVLLIATERALARVRNGTDTQR